MSDKKQITELLKRDARAGKLGRRARELETAVLSL